MALAETTEQTKMLVTAEELLHLSAGDKKYELIEGDLKEMTPPGGMHGRIAAKMSSLLLNFVNSHDLGEVLVEAGFKLASNPDTVRGPDVSFLSGEKVPAGGLPEGYISGAPNLAVEIVSPGDTASEIQDKVQDYLKYGSQLVWVIYPRQQMVMVHYPDGTAQTRHQADTLDGETIIPGFSCPISDIFAQK